MKSLIVILCLVPPLLAQGGFAPEQVISTAVAGAADVFAADLDGDGDLDVLSASSPGVFPPLGGHKIAWYENLGGGAFGSQQVISTLAVGAKSIHATDLDGDGDDDVLSASSDDDKIAWYENLGGGNFGVQQVISTAAANAQSVHAADVDGDGDVDVLSASLADDKIAWYPNLGGGSFGAQQIISATADGARSVYTVDLDGDGDPDVLSASSTPGLPFPLGAQEIAWHENLGGGSFGSPQVVSTAVQVPTCVYAEDLDGDGDSDVLSASLLDSKIAWYENLGGGSFGSQQVISTAATTSQSVYATDIDGDGDADVLSASSTDDKIAWYENLGGGSFGAQQVISTTAGGAVSVHAADLDGDGYPDALSASRQDGKVAWYPFLPVLTPMLSYNQPFPGGFVIIGLTNLIPGNEYHTVFSMDLCPGGPGTGPDDGLCLTTQSNYQFIRDQLHAPLGTPVLHFVAQQETMGWGPFFQVPPMTLDALTFDYTGAVITNPWVVRMVIQ